MGMHQPGDETGLSVERFAIDMGEPGVQHLDSGLRAQVNMLA
jgi:hypothetical protein